MVVEPSYELPAVNGPSLKRASTHLTSKARTTTTVLPLIVGVHRRQTLDQEHYLLHERCEEHGSTRVLSP